MVRLAVVGIDGSGKSTTTLRAVEALCRYMLVVKPGRPNLIGHKGRVRTYLPAAGDFFEALFQRVDRTRNRALIGHVRILFVCYAARMESWMIRRFKPQVVISSRCPIVDSAVYEEVYYPQLSRRIHLEQRLEISRIVTGLPFRNGYFLLKTPVSMAMDRIHRRIQRMYPAELMSRPYWLHLHENPATLTMISDHLEKALTIVRTRYGSGVLEIDTSRRGEIEVAGIISECTRKLPPDFSEPLLVRV